MNMLAPLVRRMFATAYGEIKFVILQIKGFCLEDGTGPAEESKRTKRVQGWSRQIGFSTFFAIHLQIVFNIMFVIYVGVNLQTIR